MLDARSATAVYFGEGKVTELGDMILRAGVRRVLLVGHQRAELAIRDGLQKTTARGVKWSVFGGFSSNPEWGDVLACARMIAEREVELVIGVGGGSALDTAKAASWLAAQPQASEAYLVWPSRNLGRRVALWAIPTTAGTGSELTCFAALYRQGRKFSIEHPSIRPDRALVDPCLSATEDAELAASTELDAFAHAVESYWSVRATPASKRLAGRAIQLLWSRRTGTSAHGRSAAWIRSLAATLAGRAIDLTRTTAAHAMSYPLSQHFGLMHGHACALTLPALLEYNARVTEPTARDLRGLSYIEGTLASLCSLLGVNDPIAAASEVRRYVSRLGLGARLHEVNIKLSDAIRVVAAEFDASRADNNPRRIDIRSVTDILTACE